jgi:hypothetical protein
VDRKFIAVLTRARHWTLPDSDEFKPNVMFLTMVFYHKRDYYFGRFFENLGS